MNSTGRTTIRACALAISTLLAGQASAAIIGESEPNNSISGGQNITGGGVTINGTGDGTFNYFTFGIGSASADGNPLNVTGTFETTTGNFDTELFLYDAVGNQLAANDDGGVGLLSRIDYDFGAGGSLHAIGLGEFNSFTQLLGTNAPMGGNTPDTGDTYTLQVEITGSTPSSATAAPPWMRAAPAPSTTMPLTPASRM